ncbi:MAG: hypothetical protein H6810_03305 [Phycisphaeraceae bacterium]|nr:MAG: hypothetical protein H6810_03305 [Phycisphaeraceae bacterium]
MTQTQTQHPAHGLDLAAGLLAVLFPGLGHIKRGEFKRGLLAAAGVLGMFFGGMLIGGIDVVDSREDKWWFYGEAFVGPIAFGVDWAYQHQFKAYGIPPETDATGKTVYRTSERQLLAEHRLRSVFPHETRKVEDVSVITNAGGPPQVRRLPVAVPAGPGEGPPNIKGLAKVNEIGTLYALCAGMLNLIVILDALFPSLRRGRGAGHG